MELAGSLILPITHTLPSEHAASLVYLTASMDPKSAAVAREYKLLKEAFVTGLNGGTVLEINWVGLVAPVRDQSRAQTLLHALRLSSLQRC